jgi:hypothetical protein
MLTNKQLAELVKKEMIYLTGDIFIFAGDVDEPEDSTPDTYKHLRDERVQVRTDRLYWLAKKFPQMYKQAWWSLADLRSSDKSPAKVGRRMRMFK